MSGACFLNKGVGSKWYKVKSGESTGGGGGNDVLQIWTIQGGKEHWVVNYFNTKYFENKQNDHTNRRTVTHI